MPNDASQSQGFDEEEGVVVTGDAGTVASVDPDAALEEVATADDEIEDEEGEEARELGG